MTSLRRCVDAYCRHCTYDPADAGTWREQVHCCHLVECPLHPVRPRSTLSPTSRERLTRRLIESGVVEDQVIEILGLDVPISPNESAHTPRSQSLSSDMRGNR